MSAQRRPPPEQERDFSGNVPTTNGNPIGAGSAAARPSRPPMPTVAARPPKPAASSRPPKPADPRLTKPTASSRPPMPVAPSRPPTPERGREAAPSARGRFAGGVERARSTYRDTVAELRKVNWPDRETTRNLTIVVIVVSIVLGILLGAIDFVLQAIFAAIP